MTVRAGCWEVRQIALEIALNTIGKDEDVTGDQGVMKHRVRPRVRWQRKTRHLHPDCLHPRPLVHLGGLTCQLASLSRCCALPLPRPSPLTVALAGQSREEQREVVTW